MCIRDRIYSGVKIYKNSIIGDSCIIHSGTVIGSDGFGFNLDKNGNQIKVSHNGNVIIEDDVEIGSNCTIDKATLGSTIIKKGVKMDNLIQVAHGVKISMNSIIAAQVFISGSTKIGEYCLIGGGVGIVDNIEIADQVEITGMSLVSRSIREKGRYSSGTIMMPGAEWKRNAVTQTKLYEMYKRLRKLEKESGILE